MPRYFFHVFNSETVVDKDGVLLSDEEAAISMGRRAVADLVSEQIVMGEQINPTHRIEIVEPDGGCKITLRFGDFFGSAAPTQETALPDQGADIAR